MPPREGATARPNLRVRGRLSRFRPGFFGRLRRGFGGEAPWTLGVLLAGLLLTFVPSLLLGLKFGEGVGHTKYFGRDWDEVVKAVAIVTCLCMASFSVVVLPVSARLARMWRSLGEP